MNVQKPPPKEPPKVANDNPVILPLAQVVPGVQQVEVPEVQDGPLLSKED
jgi:hypothetical protein